MTSRDDVATVGVSNRADVMMKEIVAESEWFQRELDVYRVAIAVALGRKLVPIPSADGRTTKFNVGTLETPSGQVAALIRTVAPEHADRPYAFSQELAEAGILYLYQHLIEESRPIHKVLLP